MDIGKYLSTLDPHYNSTVAFVYRQESRSVSEKVG